MDQLTVTAADRHDGLMADVTDQALDRELRREGGER